MNRKLPLFLLWVSLLSLGWTHSPAQKQFDVLVYTQHDVYHLDNVPAAINSFKFLSRQHDFGLEWTIDPGIFISEDILEYEAVVFLNADGDYLDEAQRQGFKNYIKQGGGYVGIHAASATEEKWPWYDQLVGRVFKGHPRVQTAVLTVEKKDNPATYHLPEHWIWTDEWYNFGEPMADNLVYLLTVDESTYDPTRGYGEEPFQGMGDFHPIAWYHEFEGGRAFYSALGHMPEAFEDMNHLNFLYGGIYWAATGK